MERYGFRAKTAVDGALFLPIIIPDIAMAIMLLAFFVLVGMQLGLTTIIIAHVAFNISFVAVIVRARMASIDPDLAEAARDLYANEWKEFWRVTFPQLIPGILAGALFAFTLSFDDYVISLFHLRAWLYNSPDSHLRDGQKRNHAGDECCIQFDASSIFCISTIDALVAAERRT